MARFSALLAFFIVFLLQVDGEIADECKVFRGTSSGWSGLFGS